MAPVSAGGTCGRGVYGGRLMRDLGLQGVTRGGTRRMTVADEGADKPGNLVNQAFNAMRPNQLWVADFTYVATWRGFVQVAFVMGAFASRIIGWRVVKTMQTELVPNVLEQALWARGGHVDWYTTATGAVSTCPSIMRNV